jgi:raffinose/stachyose/melibiose transport system substrate-binding protein
MKTGKLAALIAAAAAVMAVGAVGATAKTSADVTLNLTMNVAYQKATDLLIANFNRVYPDIHVRTTYLTNTQIAEVVPTQLQAGNGPDLWWANSGFPTGAAAMASAGRVVDLSNRPWVSRVGGIKADASYKGKVYGFPAGLVPAGVFYNGSIFRQLKLKVPTTFSQFLSLCGKIKADGKTPIAYAMGSGTGSVQNAFITLMALPVFAQDPKWTQERSSGKVSFSTSAAWNQALQRVLAMKSAGCFPSHPEGLSIGDLTGMVTSGQAVMTIDSSAFEAGLKSTNPSWPLDSTFALPAPSAKDTRLLVYVSPVIAINSASHNRASAVKFIDFLGRVKQDSLFNKVASQLAPYDASHGNLPSWGAGIASYFKSQKTINNPASAWPNTGLNTIYLTDMVGLFTGQKTVADILKDLDANWKAP